MDEKNLEVLLCASEQIDYIVLLSKLAESAIENGNSEKTWDLYLLFGIIKNISQKTLKELREIFDN